MLRVRAVRLPAPTTARGISGGGFFLSVSSSSRSAASRARDSSGNACSALFLGDQERASRRNQLVVQIFGERLLASILVIGTREPALSQFGFDLFAPVHRAVERKLAIPPGRPRTGRPIPSPDRRSARP